MWLSIGALLVPALIGYLVALLITRSANPESTQIWFYPGLMLGVAVGALLLSQFSFSSKSLKLLVVLAYLPAMSYILMFILVPAFHNNGTPHG